MRVQVGNTLRVGPGDQVVIRARLPAAAKLGRLLVFASENGAQFSPYVQNVAEMLVANGKPTMLAPLSMRLVGSESTRTNTFTADINGFVRVMQEVDGLDDVRAVVKMTRTINPNLGALARLQRKLSSWQRPRHTS
jgi:hypothetical protein